MSRRAGARTRRAVGRGGGIGGGGALATPATILGSLAWWLRADLGFSAGVWEDQSGNGVHFTQGVGAAQPALLATDAGGKPAVLGDGSDDVLNATWARVAPGTQPVYFWLVCKQATWNGASAPGIFGDFSGAGFALLQFGSTPQTQLFNGAIVLPNGAGTLGAYRRHEIQLTGPANADFNRIGSTNVGGGSAGNSAGSGSLQLFNIGDSSAGRFTNVAIAEAFAFLGTPNAGQRALLDAYCAARYGAGLV